MKRVTLAVRVNADRVEVQFEEPLLVDRAHHDLTGPYLDVARRHGASPEARTPGDWPTDPAAWQAAARSDVRLIEARLDSLDPGDRIDHAAEVTTLESIVVDRRLAIGWCEGCDEDRRELAVYLAGTRPSHFALWCPECAATRRAEGVPVKEHFTP